MPSRVEIVRLQRKAQRDRQGHYLASGAKVADLVHEYVLLAQQGNWDALYKKIDDNTQQSDTHPNAVIWALLILITKYANARGQSFVPIAKQYAAAMWARPGSEDMHRAMKALQEAGVILPDIN